MTFSIPILARIDVKAANRAANKAYTNHIPLELHENIYHISIITLAVVRIISKPADAKHQWGHGRAETVATAFLSFIIFFAGGQLIISSVTSMVSGEKDIIRLIMLILIQSHVYFEKSNGRIRYIEKQRAGTKSSLSWRNKPLLMLITSKLSAHASRWLTG